MGPNSFFLFNSLSNPRYHMPSYAENRIDNKKVSGHLCGISGCFKADTDSDGFIL